ncbi:MAG: hypothetical protein NVSMB64_15690 [Candidatus Velthaea sp.]
MLPTLAVVSASTIVPGGVYWFAVGFNPIRCIFGDAVCSLTISTYLLGALTALVFAATLIGALYAKEAFEHERRAGLSLEKCNRGADCPYETRSVYLAELSEGFLPVAPLDFEPDLWGRVAFDCVSVGKAPLIGCELEIAMSAEKDPITHAVAIGSLKAGSELHLHLWFAPQFFNSQMLFLRARHEEANLRFYRVDASVDPIYDFPFNLSQPETSVSPSAGAAIPSSEGVMAPAPLRDGTPTAKAVSLSALANTVPDKMIQAPFGETDPDFLKGENS